MPSINLGRTALFTFLTLTISLAPVKFLKLERESRAVAQTSTITQTDIGADLQRLANVAQSAQSFDDLYDVGLAYFELAELAGQLGFMSEKSEALLNAERALLAVVNNTGIFSFVRNNIPAQNSTWSHTNGSGFNMGWSWSSGQSVTSCSVQSSGDAYDSALENSASRLLQRIYIAQNQAEPALLAAEFGRTTAIDRSIFYNTAGSSIFGSSRGPDLCKLAEDLAPRLTVEDIKQLARNENATIVSYSIISYQDDSKLITNLQHIRWTGSNAFSTRDLPSTLYIWVIQPTGQISFVEQPLSKLNPELFSGNCDSSESCRPLELINLAIKENAI